MRVLLPRSGRGRGLGGLAAAALVAAVLFAVLGGGGDEREQRAPAVRADPTPTETAERRRTPTPGPATRVRETAGELAIGITEPNPNFFGDGDVPGAFARWRDDLLELKPSLYRLAVSWADLKPAPDAPLHADMGRTGCMRDRRPCAGWQGLRAQLRALGQRQREGGWEALVIVYGTPPWAAQDPRGCERAGTTPFNRPARPGMEAHYGRMVEEVIALARAEGAALRYWSPWNEPNHPGFISPQRTRCSATAPSAAVRAYARLARALAGALERAPGEQEIVLGELAGLTDVKQSYTSVREFASELPRDVACSGRIWGQHFYVGGENPIDDVTGGLRVHRCPRSHEIWMTETGVGGTQTGAERTTTGTAACRAIRRQLLRWYEDPRVTAAIQYTLREDDAFPVGLVTTNLKESYATLAEWKAWGSRRRPDPSDPPPRSQCGG